MTLFAPKWLQLRLPNGTILVEKCRVADDFWSRGKGLLGRQSLPENEGLWLIPSRSIHMFGMKFAIDVVFLTKDDVITDLSYAVAPGKISAARDKGAGKPFSALEVAVGTIHRSGAQVGDKIQRQYLA